MNKLIMETLSPTEKPVYYMTYTGTKSEYIIFNWWSSPLIHADNLEQRENVTIQLDVFSKGDFTSLVETIKRLMADADFMKVHEGSGAFIEDADLFRKTLRYSYTK